MWTELTTSAIQRGGMCNRVIVWKTGCWHIRLEPRPGAPGR